VSTIFISYASQDRETARTLASFLEAQGHSVWWDRTIPPGRVFDEVIQEALAAARCVVVLWSSHSVRSNWVKVEAEDAAARGLLLPVLIEHVTPPIQFKRIQAANLSDWRGDENDPEVRGLLAAVQHLLGRPPTAVATPGTARPAPAGLGGTVRIVAWSVAVTLGVVAVVLLYRGRGAQDADGEAPAGAAATAAAPAATGGGASGSGPGASAAPATIPRDVPAPVRHGELLNLLSPQNGGELIAAQHADWEKTFDGDENTHMWQGVTEAVFGFAGGAYATVEGAEVLIKGANQYNVSEMEVATSTVGPEGPFTSPEVIRTRNMLIVKERYQRTTFPPRTARYVRVRILKSHSGSAPGLDEWRLLGTIQKETAGYERGARDTQNRH
jgi:hypothetical protein